MKYFTSYGTIALIYSWNNVLIEVIDIDNLNLAILHAGEP